MQKRKLGHEGLEVSALGLGTMMMPNNEDSVRTILGALDLGVTMFDTADIYGEFLQQRFGVNEKLVGRALKGRRQEAVIATKFGVTHSQGPKGDPAYIKKSVDASLFQLGIDYIDLYYQHRVDPNTPIEETVGTMADLVKEGKIRYIGLSEASAEQIRRAHAVHPITAGRLSPPISAVSRREFLQDLEVVSLIEKMAAQKGCTASQLALAWLLAQGDHIVPIPGTKRLERVQENLGAMQVSLSEDDLAEIERISPKGFAAGARYPGLT